MQRLMKSMPVFLVLYVLFMIPTYLLPYLGSNSSAATLFGGAVGGLGGMFPPQWWAHMFVLGALIIIAWARGSVVVGRGYLPALAFLAALFDMTPIVRAIPLVPTLLHLGALIMGVVNCSPKDDLPAPVRSWRRPEAVLAGMALIAAIGATWSMASMRSAKEASNRAITDMIFGTASPSKSKSAAPVKEDHTASDKEASNRAITNMIFGGGGRSVDSKPQAAATVAPSKAPVEQKQVVATPEKPAVIDQPTAPAPVAEQSSVTVAMVAPTPAPTAKAEAVPAKPVVEKPKKSAETEPKTVASANAGIVSDFLSDGRSCLAAKRYDCAQSQAKAVLRLEPGNLAAKTLLSRAKADQQAALDSIEIQ